MKILVTGGAGFIGSHLARRLGLRGDSITILDNFNDFYDPAIKQRNIERLREDISFDLVEGDIRQGDWINDLFKKSQFDGVIHLAARAGVRPSLMQPVLYEEVNCIGTLHLLEAARRHGPQTFIFGSSSSVYGINSKVPFSEEDPINLPISPYATTKRSGELLSFNYHHLYDLQISCLRFFTVYGPSQRPEMAIHKFTRMIAEGESIPLFGDGHSQRDYTYVEDIVDGIVAALDHSYPFEIFNLGGSDTTTLKDLVGLIGRELDVEPLVEYLPNQPGDVPITYADVSKAKRLLSYQPKIPIDTGIARFVEWFLQERGKD